MKFLIFALLFFINQDHLFSKQKTLTVITTPESPPFSMMSKNNIIGFEIDLIRYIANQIGYKLEIKSAEFKSYIPSILYNKADLAIGEMSPTEKRKQSVDFSECYYYNSDTFFSLKNIQSMSDLNGKKIGIKLGNISGDFMYKYAKKYNFTIELLESNVGGLELLKSGKIDVLMFPSNRKNALLKNNKWIKYTVNIFDLKNVSTDINIEELQSISCVAIVMKKGFFLKAELDKILIEMKQSGEIQKMLSKYDL